MALPGPPLPPERTRSFEDPFLGEKQRTPFPKRKRRRIRRTCRCHVEGWNAFVESRPPRPKANENVAAPLENPRLASAP